MDKPTTQPNAKQCHFEPFAWLTERQFSGKPEFVEKVKDITQGIGQALQLIERSGLDSDDCVTPVLNNYQQSVFMRLAITSLEMLHDEADHQIATRNERSRNNG